MALKAKEDRFEKQASIYKISTHYGAGDMDAFFRIEDGKATRIAAANSSSTTAIHASSSIKLEDIGNHIEAMEQLRLAILDHMNK